MLPFGSSGLVQATIMLSDVIASALICSGGPGTVNKPNIQGTLFLKRKSIQENNIRWMRKYRSFTIDISIQG
jgi:hypothetical protein